MRLTLRTDRPAAALSRAEGPTPPRLPRARTSVTLRRAGGERLPAWVQRSEPHALTLVSIIPLPAISDEELERMVLEYGVPGGRVRLGGHFEAGDTDAPEVLLLREPHLLEVVQERAFARAPASLPVALTVGGGKARLRAYTVDISAGGFLLDGAAWLRVGDTIHFELRLSPLEPPVSGSGRVVRVDRRGRRGVAFDAIDSGRWQQLIDFTEDRLLEHTAR